MKRILVYEYLSGGGEMGDLGDALAPGAALLALGQAMRDATEADLIALNDYDVSVATRCLASPVPEPEPNPAAAPTPQPGAGPFDFVARHADAHHRVWVMAPETDGLLQHFQRAIGPARWLGCVGIDPVWHPERAPVLIEVNPCLTGAEVGLPPASGRNLAAEVMAACGGPSAHVARVARADV